ncbi:secreted protein [Melampsora americana]|nr:secreted protein [Melampsora americana]
MRKPSESKLKDILLLWANMNFYVKGHPAFSEDGLHIAEGTKVLKPTTQGENMFRNTHFINNGPHLEIHYFDKNPGTSEDLHSIKTGSGDSGIVRTSNPLQFNPEDTSAFRNQGLIELDSFIGRCIAVRQHLEFLSPNQVRQLPPDDLIRYIAKRDSVAAKEAINLYELAQAYTQAEKKAFLVAAGRNGEKLCKDIDDWALKKVGKKTQISVKQLKMSVRFKYIIDMLNLDPSENLQQHFQTLQEAYKSYDVAYTKIYQAAKGLTESFTPQDLSKLNNKEYVRKAALFDKNVNQKYEQWLKAEKTLYKAEWRSNSRSPATSSLNEGDQVLNCQTDAKALRFEKEVKGKGQPIDEMRIQEVAEKDIIKKEASGKKAESEALRSADKLYKNNHFLKSSGFRYKPWSLANFLTKMFA